MIVGLHDVHYPVQNMARAVAFYRDVLGMRLIDTHPQWSSLEFFGARIGLIGAQEAPGHGGVLTLRTTDLDADLNYLRQNGATVLNQSDNPWGRIAAFRDTEGNVLKLMQAPDPAKTSS